MIAQARRFDHIKQHRMPFDPRLWSQERAKPTWVPVCEEHFNEVGWYTSPDLLRTGSWEEQVFEWLEGLTMAAIFVEEYYCVPQ